MFYISMHGMNQSIRKQITIGLIHKGMLLPLNCVAGVCPLLSSMNRSESCGGSRLFGDG